MRALTTKNINRVLKTNSVTKKYFLGTYPACILPSRSNQPYSFITNTHKHDEPGEHWNAWFINKNKLSFFDSFGRDPRDVSFPQFYGDIVRQFSHVSFTVHSIQDISSVTCGHFCIHFIYYVLSLKLDLHFFLSDYSDNLRDKDTLAVNIYNSS